MSSISQQRRMVLRLLMISLSIFLASLWGWVQRRSEAPRPAPAPRTSAPAGAPESAAQAPPRRSGSYQPGAHTAIPRPAVIDAAASAAGGERERRAAPEASRAQPGAAALAPQELIAAVIRDIQPDIEDCLIQWWMLDPALEGAVTVRLSLGPGGLESAEIEDHSGVPKGPLGCLGATLYTEAWPAPETRQVVSHPFAFFSEERG